MGKYTAIWQVAMSVGLTVILGSPLAGRLAAQANGTITTVAGNMTAGFSGDGGPAPSAQLSIESYGVFVDRDGTIYIADSLNHRVRRITPPGSTIETVAGNGLAGYAGDGGPATAARLNCPLAVARDSAGHLYISDQNNNRIRRVDGATGVISTVAGDGARRFAGDGGPAVVASLSHPFGIAVDAEDNLYIADTGNHRIRKVTGGAIATIAGSGPAGGTGSFGGDGGPATSAFLRQPSFVALDSAGNVYIADEQNQRVRKVTTATGAIATIAGTGVAGYSGDGGEATLARLNRPSGVAVDAAGHVYISDYLNFRVRKITNGIITTVVGLGWSGMGQDGVAAAAAPVTDPVGVAVDAAGNLFVMDQASFRVRKITPSAVARAPIITGQPMNAHVVPGGRASFTAAASAIPEASVRWQIRTSGGTWADVPGATTSALSLPAGPADHGNQVRAVFTNPAGTVASPAARVVVRNRVLRHSDVDGDGITDFVVWRPSNGTWRSLTSTTTYSRSEATTRQWGSAGAGDIPLLGDIDGDAIADPIVWRPATGTWYWLTSVSGYSPGQSGIRQWGNQGAGDVPITGDVDGDGRTDLIVWRASTGTWFWLTSSSGYSYAAAGARQWGSKAAGDIPKVADIDGDGRDDLTVWRATTGTWYWLPSSRDYDYAAAGVRQWGNQAEGDIPLLGDTDGDGAADFVIWRPSRRVWHLLTSSTGHDPAAAIAQQWGNVVGDVPFLTDVDGDEQADLTLWDTATATWSTLTFASGYRNSASSEAKIWVGRGQRDIPIVK